METLIPYTFRDPTLLDAALTHRSYRFEQNESCEDNQRLEFLGDAVLDLLAAERLYTDFPEEREGALTKIRSRMTSDERLAELAAALGIGQHLLLGRGEEACGGASRASNLADALEALFGALFLDGGMDAARVLFDTVYHEPITLTPEHEAGHNPKGTLLEYCQQQWKTSPEYNLLEESGPAHARFFTVRCTIPDGRSAEGSGSTKRKAEADAAESLLLQLM